MSKEFPLPPKKSKRVKWVPAPLLCQVKLFMLDDCPSKIGSEFDNFLQANTSSMLQSDETGLDDTPPGFGSVGSSEALKTCAPQIKWKSPPMFILNRDWQVGAGELSEETGAQKRRETRVLEAVYPRPSAIPLSPSVSPGLGEYDYDDDETPVIPIIPIEEDDAVYKAPSLIPAPICSNSVVANQDEVPLRSTQHDTLEEPKLITNEKSGGMFTGLEADISAAASAAFTAIMKSNEKGSLIDTDLLVKILSDPTMIAKLSKDSGFFSTTKINSVNEPKPAPSVFAPTIECQSTMPQKPLYENSNMHNLAQHTSHFASKTFSRSEKTQVLNLPLSNAEPLNKNTNQSYKDSRFFSTTEINPVNEPKPAPSVSAPTIECQSTMPQKPMYESSNMHNLAQHPIHFASNTFSRSEETQVLNFPLSNAKPLNENTNQSYKDLRSSASAFSVSTPITSLDLLDKSMLMQVISSIHTSVPNSGSKMAFPSTFCSSLSDTINPKREVFGQEFPQLVPSSSSSLFSRFNDISSNILSHNDKELLHKSGRETYQPSLQTNTIALSLNPGNCSTEMMSTTHTENQCLLQENHLSRSFSQYISSPSDRPSVHPVSSVKTSVVKDKSYLKSLIELHGVERQVSPGEYLQQYRPKASEFIRVTGEGEAKTKVPKPCRYFNSSQGCRNGSSCPFQHDPLLQLRAGSLPDSHSSKRFKLSREIS